MTEADWISCTDPVKMLDFIRARTSQRKLRLYLCGGCRYIAHLFFDAASVAAVEVGERFADGQADEEDLDRAEWAAESPTFGFDFQEWFWNGRPDEKREVVARLVELGVLPEDVLRGGEWRVNGPIKRQLTVATRLAQTCAVRSWSTDWWDEIAKYISLVDWPGRWLWHCIFADPFRPLPARSFPPHVVGLADSCYAAYPGVSGDFLILADALDDLGEGDAAAHCRGPLHVMGCHVLDWILGRD